MTEFRVTRRTAARPAALLLPVLLLLTWQARAGETPSVDATLTLAEPALPAPKAGGKLLRHAFGESPGDTVRAEIEAELRELDAFREIVPEGGEMRLEVKLTSVKDEFRDVDDGESGSSYGVNLEAETAWHRGETPLHAQRFELSRRIPVDQHPTRQQLESTLLDLFRDLGERAFSSLYGSKFFEGLGNAGRGRPAETGVVK